LDDQIILFSRAHKARKNVQLFLLRVLDLSQVLPVADEWPFIIKFCRQVIVPFIVKAAHPVSLEAIILLCFLGRESAVLLSR